tara:strand:- start:58 stop:1152 length:1095 start_codon:yes stop_codon:yes gene_type:complete
MKKLLLTAVTALTILFAQAQQCQADFSYMQNGSTTIFADLSTINSSWSTNYSVTWEWDFGDGTISTQQNPVHTYANNGIYTPCLTVLYFDSVIINSCVSFYCDSILIGNSIPASWDCNPTTGCYDPGTGLGQYNSFSSCDTMCGNIVTPSWDCNPNMLGCSDPGTGNGQYLSLAACQAICGTPTPSWDCDPVNGCYDPGTGLGLYNTLVSCQSNCSSATSNYCDSMTASGSQSQIIMEVNSINTFIDYWVTTGGNAVLGEDSMSITHNVFNYNSSTSLPYDTITTCITTSYGSPMTITCCVTWVWNGTFWAKMGSVTSIGEINLDNKKLIKIVDVLGRETFSKNKEILFYIYDDGTIEKKYIIE